MLRAESDRSKWSCFLQNEEGRDPRIKESGEGCDVIPTNKRVSGISFLQVKLVQDPCGDTSGTGPVWVLTVDETTSGRKEVMGCLRRGPREQTKFV